MDALKIHTCKYDRDLKNLSYYQQFDMKCINFSILNANENFSKILSNYDFILKAIFICLYTLKNIEIENLNLIIAGNQESGKTYLCVTIALSIDKFIPLTMLSSSELYYCSQSSIQTFIQSLRKSIALYFYTESIVIRGQVVDIRLKKYFNKKNKTFAKLVLKNDETLTIYKIDSEMYRMILKNEIKNGDIVQINKEKNIIKKLQIRGKFRNSKKNMANETENYEIIESIITLYELDLLNSSLKFSFSKLFIEGDLEIPNIIRNKVDRIISKWHKSKKIKIIKGFFLLDDMISLDNDCLALMIEYLENFLSPTFILSSSFIFFKKNPKNFFSYYGLPLDFLDRFLFIQTSPLSFVKIKKILLSKEKKDLLVVDSETNNLLIKIAIECGIRYSLQIVTILGVKQCNIYITRYISEIKKLFIMFVDSKRFIRNIQKLKKI